MIELGKCTHCNQPYKNFYDHLKNEHAEQFDTYNRGLVEKFKEGMSAGKIAALPESLYGSDSSVLRMIRKYLSAEEIAQYRKLAVEQAHQRRTADRPVGGAVGE